MVWANRPISFKAHSTFSFSAPSPTSLSTDGPSPSAYSRYRKRFCRYSRVRSILPSTAWSIKVGSQPNGQRAKLAAKPSSTASPATAANNSKKRLPTGSAFRRPSTSSSQKPDISSKEGFMRSFQKLRTQIATLLRARADSDLDAELRFHLDQEIAENLAAGMNAEEARRAATHSFGNL